MSAIAAAICLASGVAAADAAPPANDAFAHAEWVASAATPSTLQANTTEATREANEPGPTPDAHPGPTVWYRWTATESRSVTVSTCGQTSLDTVIYVFRGAALDSLSTVVANDDALGGSCGTQSKVSFTSQRGIAYSIQLSTFGTAPAGQFSAILDKHGPLLNDNLASAVTIPGVVANYTFDSTAATKETGEPDHAGNLGGKSVWYSWQAPATGNASISTCGSNFDTLLAVYTGNAVNGLTPVVSNDDGCNGKQSSVDLAVTAGTVYRIAIDGFNSSPSTTSTAAAGAGVLNFQAGLASPAPTLMIDGPNGTIASPAPSFYFGADRFVGEFTCSMDAGPGTPCTPAQQYSALADGQHTFHLSVGATSATRTFTVDTTPPAIQITSPVAGATTNASPTFGFAAGGDAAQVQCSVDAGSPSFGPCSEPGSHTPAAALSEGTHTFRVRVTDAIGNQQTATRDFTVDATPPTITIDSPAADTVTADTSPSFSFTAGGDAVAVQCSIDAGIAAFAVCSGPGSSHTPTTPIPDGTYAFRVRVADAVGNERTATRNFTIDTADRVAPQTQIDGLKVKRSKRKAKVSFSGSDDRPGAVRFECRLDQGAYTPCFSPTSFKRLKAGKHTIYVRAVDAAANVDTTPATKTLKLRRRLRSTDAYRHRRPASV